MAAPAMMTGSCSFLNRHSNKSVVRAISVVGMSIKERFPRTITAPVIAPMAAAVTPSTKAMRPGSLPYFLK